jgi:hypothetical protein
MRIDPAKLDYLGDLCSKKFSYDDIMGRIINYIEQNPDFKKEVFA